MVLGGVFNPLVGPELSVRVRSDGLGLDVEFDSDMLTFTVGSQRRANRPTSLREMELTSDLGRAKQ